MVTPSSVLAWRIPGTVEPGGLPSMGLHRVGHDWSDLAVAVAAVSIPGLGRSPGESESESCSVMSSSLPPLGLYSPQNSPGQDTGVGSLSLLQQIFQTQESNQDLPHCRQIHYQISHKGSPRILEWVSYPFSSRSSRPRNRTRVSCSAGGFFAN